MIFLNSASSAAALVFYLPGVYTHTDTEGKQRKARVRNIFKNSEKTQCLMNTLYKVIFDLTTHQYWKQSIFGSATSLWSRLSFCWSSSVGLSGIFFIKGGKLHFYAPIVWKLTMSSICCCEVKTSFSYFSRLLRSTWSNKDHFKVRNSIIDNFVCILFYSLTQLTLSDSITQLSSKIILSLGQILWLSSNCRWHIVSLSEFLVKFFVSKYPDFSFPSHFSSSSWSSNSFWRKQMATLNF